MQPAQYQHGFEFLTAFGNPLYIYVVARTWPRRKPLHPSTPVPTPTGLLPPSCWRLLDGWLQQFPTSCPSSVCTVLAKIYQGQSKGSSELGWKFGLNSSSLGACLMGPSPKILIPLTRWAALPGCTSKDYTSLGVKIITPHGHSTSKDLSWEDHRPSSSNSKLLWKCSLNYRQSSPRGPYPAREVATQTSIWFAKVVEPVPVHHNPSTGICNLHSNLRIAFSNMAFGIQLKV